MLEIEHFPISTGCQLTLETPAGSSEHLRLTSKSVCKRIVRLDARLTHCVIRIHQPDISLDRVTFTPLTKKFAISRLRKRLLNRGSGELLDGADSQGLYAAYQAQLNDGLIAPAYHYDAFDFDVAAHRPQVNEQRQSGVRLLLVRACEKSRTRVHHSVEAALEFGRECGWQIEWQSTSGLTALDDQTSHDCRLFIMPVLPGAEYRVDVFHQMLDAVQSETQLVYADHDHIDGCGRHRDPVLKPEWNPELLLNTDYIRLPWMISGIWGRQALKAHASSAANVQGVLLSASLGQRSQSLDDLVDKSICSDDELCVTTDGEGKIPALLTSEVVRVPQVLASLLPPEASAADPLLSDASSWRQQVIHALHNAGSSAQLTTSRYAGTHRILWPLSNDTPSVDIIIPTRDSLSVLKTCIESILSKTSYTNFRLLVVDNNSQQAATEKYYKALTRHSCFHLLRYTGAFNYSAINNFAVRHSQADVLLLLNNDTEVRSADWLDEMVRQAMRPQIGCVGAKLYFTNGRIQHGGVITGITGVAGHAHRYCPGNAQGYCGRLLMSQNFSAVTAACLAIRRSTWIEAGGLDEDDLGIAWNDVDLCLKVQALGYRNLWTPHAELFHHEGGSRGPDDTRKKVGRVDAERQTMLDRWGLDQGTDPAYHPLLTRDSEGFTLSVSPH